MNVVILIGRLTKDIEIRQTQSAEPMSIASFTLAVDRHSRDPQQSADFISCTAFGKTADSMANWLHKGSKIAITGHIQTGQYQNRQGVTVYTTKVIIDTWEFVESKGAAQSSPQKAPEPVTDAIEEELPFV